MPLKKGKKNIGKNIRELTTGKVGKTRAKAIRTMQKKGIKNARRKQAIAIALNKAK